MRAWLQATTATGKRYQLVIRLIRTQEGGVDTRERVVEGGYERGTVLHMSEMS